MYRGKCKLFGICHLNHDILNAVPFIFLHLRCDCTYFRNVLAYLILFLDGHEFAITVLGIVDPRKVVRFFVLF